MLAVAVVLAALMALTRRDVAYLLVLVWAFIGIASKHAGAPLVSISAWAATGLVAVAAVWSLVRKVAPARRNGATTGGQERSMFFVPFLGESAAAQVLSTSSPAGLNPSAEGWKPVHAGCQVPPRTR